MKYTLATEHDTFLRAKNLLNQLTVLLKSPKWLQAEHGEVEEMIQKDGFEILRLLFQGNLDERAIAETDLTTDPLQRSHSFYLREGCTRQLNCIFGPVVVRRKGYSVDDNNSAFPQDAELNLSKDSYSDGLRLKTAYSVCDLSFEKSATSILKNTASSVPKRQIENITGHLSQDFDAFYENRDVNSSCESDLLVLSCDGKGIVMRQEDLREVTQKAAQSECHKKQTRLSRGEKRNRKRMAMVATVYDVSPHLRSAQSIMGSTEKKSAPPKPHNKRVWASVEKLAIDVIRDMFAEALRRDPYQKRKWVVLIDGQPAQEQAIKKVMKELNVRASIIMDFIHVLEYLWKAAYCFHEESSQEAEDWVMKRSLKILAGEASGVAAGIRRSSTKRGLSNKKRESADLCADYLLKKKKYLQYETSLKKGYPIATGVIEGACRYLIKDRLDITGARWGLKGAESIIKIRALVTSNDFEEYFKFHKQQEQIRNYPFLKQNVYRIAA